MKKTHIKLQLICLIFALFLIPAACSKVVAAEETGSKHIIYAVNSSPWGIDPQKISESDKHGIDVAINHLEGLFAYDYSDSKQITPRLAQNMGTWNEAGTEWTISLRKDVYWHDGSRFTAADIKWNWDRLNYLAARHESAHDYLWFNDDGDLILEETELIDNFTFKFRLSKPWMDFVYLQTFTGCYQIKPIEGKEEVLIENDEYGTIIGTGPFILNEYSEYNQTRFIANANYYRGGPYIQEVIFKVYENSDATNQALLNHEAQVAANISPISFDEDPSLDYSVQTGSCNYFYHLNVNNIPWAIRKAIQYAINYTKINSAYINKRIELHTPVIEGMVGHNPNLSGLPNYNLTKARQYMLNDPSLGSLIQERINDTNSDQEWINCAKNNPIGSYSVISYNWVESILFKEDMEHIGLNINYGTVPEGSWFYSNMDEVHLVGGWWYSDYWELLDQFEFYFKSDASGCKYRSQLLNESIDNMIDEAHSIFGYNLDSKIDEIVNAIIVEQAAAVYWGQSQYNLGWSVDNITDMGDLLNNFEEKYFYKVNFQISEEIGLTISGYPNLLVNFFVFGIGLLNLIHIKSKIDKSDML